MLRAAKRWYFSIKARLGRRGSGLLFFAFVDLMYSYFLFTAPPQLRQAPSYIFLASILPLWGWALAWAIPGLTCIFCAFRKKDVIAFTATMAIKITWTSVYLAGAVLGEIQFGYITATFWFSMAMLVRLISGWPEEVVNGQ